MTSRRWAACPGLAAALMVGPMAPVAAVTPVQAVPAATDNAANDGGTRSAAPDTDASQPSAPHADAQAEAIMRTSRFRGLAAELRCRCARTRPCWTPTPIWPRTCGWRWCA
ncbi:hypothetical protein V8H18_14360 [Lautropia mirabilis]